MGGEKIGKREKKNTRLEKIIAIRCAAVKRLETRGIIRAPKGFSVMEHYLIEEFEKTPDEEGAFIWAPTMPRHYSQPTTVSFFPVSC